MAIKSIKRWTPYSDWEKLDLALDISQVCAILRISRPTCVKLLQSGELPGTKVAAQWRVSRDALRAYLGENLSAKKTG